MTDEMYKEACDKMSFQKRKDKIAGIVAIISDYETEDLEQILFHINTIITARKMFDEYDIER